MPITNHRDLLDDRLYFPGQESHLNGVSNSVVYTKVNRSTAIIPFGLGVARGITDGSAVLPSDANSVFLGVAKYMDIEKRPGISIDASGRFGAPINHEFPVLEEGIIAAFIDGNVTEGGQVWWNFNASAGVVVGAFRGAQVTGANVQIIGATWLATVTGATPTAMRIAPLRLNRP